MAEQQEVEHCTQANCNYHKNAQAALADGDGVKEQGGGQQQPKEKIQRGTQGTDRDAPPQNPHQVVDQARPHAQGRRPGKRERLAPKINAHPNGTAARTGRPGRRHRPRR